MRKHPKFRQPLQHSAEPTIHQPTDESWNAAYSELLMANFAFDGGSMDEAQRLFARVSKQFSDIKASLRDQVFIPNSESLTPVEMTEENRGLIFRYIEVVTHLAELQMKFSHYEEAEPNLKEFLSLAKYTGDSTANEIFNLGVVNNERYKKNQDAIYLKESSYYFIQALLQYRELAPDEKKSTVVEIIENARLMASHKNNDKFAFSELAECEQDLLTAIVSDVLTKEQLQELCDSGDTALGFFQAEKWQHPLATLSGVSKEQYKKIKKLQKNLIPEVEETWQKNKDQTPSGNKKRSPSPRKNAPKNPLKDEPANNNVPVEQRTEKENSPTDGNEVEGDDRRWEKFKKGFRYAFEQFRQTYRKGEVRAGSYHPTEHGSDQLRRVMYFRPPEGSDPEEFVEVVIKFLLSKNLNKANAKKVDKNHIVKKLPNNQKEWTVEFQNVKTSSNTKKTVKVVLNHRAMGTVAVALGSAVNAYILLGDSVEASPVAKSTPKAEPSVAARPLEAPAPKTTTRLETGKKDPQTGKDNVSVSSSSSDSSLPPRKKLQPEPPPQEDAKRAREDEKPEADLSASDEKKKQKLNEIAAVATPPTPAAPASPNKYENPQAFFKYFPEVQKALKIQEEEKEAARIAREAAEMAKNDAAKKEAALAAAKSKVAALREKRAERLAKAIEKDIEPIKREREEAEREKEESLKRAKAAAEELLRMEKELEMLEEGSEELSGPSLGK